MMGIVEELRRDLSANAFPPSFVGLLRGLLSSPGILALLLYRVSSRASHHSGFAASVLRVLASRTLSAATGCFFSPHAIIASGIHLPHATGIVIGEGAVVETRTTIYQNVTIGRRHEADLRYPRICEGAILYAGAVVVGGIVVGKDAVVGANVVVASDVADGERVVQAVMVRRDARPEPATA